MRYVIKKRASGILLHITSLPSRYGIGDVGDEAYRFADFLARAKQGFWQVLPINPPAPVKNSWSPYNCLSAFAGNTLLISPDFLYREGLLTKKDIESRPAFPNCLVDFIKVVEYKTKLLNTACERFRCRNNQKDYESFCIENKSWLEDYATFAVLRGRFKIQLWCNWPAILRDRNKDGLEAMKIRLQDDINREKILQYLFFRQWSELKDYCNQKGIRIIGDVPFYVAYDSSDVWSNPEIFKLTRSRNPQFVAGVPPDLFSSTGQLWGNPVYNWKKLKETNYSWWVERIKHYLKLFDIVRLDHFRGFFDYWQVPARNKTAAMGRWIKGPAEDFFKMLFRRLPNLPIIAEDLGYITPRIRDFMEKSNIAGTRVLQFAFGKDSSTKAHFPDNYIRNSVVYTGTHDNNTMRGWFEKEADAGQKKRLFNLLGHKVSNKNIRWEFINLASGTCANLVIIPMQDVLGLGQKARMNRPGTVKGNWLWRLRKGQIRPKVALKLKRLTQTNGRG